MRNAEFGMRNERLEGLEFGMRNERLENGGQNAAR
jgi:hypothetical protein